jgi:uncharacterized protein YneF (UPF0154 family)
MNDTSPEMEARMLHLMAAKTPEERLRMAGSMFDAGKELVKAGLLHEDPSLNEAQLRARIFVRLYGQDFSKTEIAKILRAMPNMQSD